MVQVVITGTSWLCGSLLLKPRMQAIDAALQAAMSIKVTRLLLSVQMLESATSAKSPSNPLAPESIFIMTFAEWPA